MLTERPIMKLAHCPTCRDFVALLNAEGMQRVTITLKHMRRAHVDHSMPRTNRRLIHNGRKA
jgi:hypothetical protein